MASTGIAESPRARRLREGGQWLREQREQRGWTGRHLASLVGITPTQISNYERGKDGIDDDRAAGIAHALGMSIIEVRRALGLWLPDGSEPPPPRPSVTPEEAIRADPTLRPDQRDMLLALLATIRNQPSPIGGQGPIPGGGRADQTFDL